MAKGTKDKTRPKVDRRTNITDDPEAVVARERVRTMIDQIPPEALVESIKKAPSLRGMVLGYVAELMFESHVHKRYPVILSGHIESHDDHKRTVNKADRTVTYKGRRYGIQLKSMQTNTIGRNVKTGLLQANIQNDGSDSRDVVLSDGSKVRTVYYKIGDYDILAVPLFPFSGKWDFSYKRNRDCRICGETKTYTKFQGDHLLAGTEKITWPLSDEWHTDLLSLLDASLGKKVE